jgi:quinone-modifying oxidoreductase subunit QmoA
MTENNETTPAAGGSILVVGGGISGLTAAIEAAEVGYEVFLVEKEASLGGRVAQLNKYFPKLCPPTCGLEINYRRIKDNPNIKVLTLTEVETIDGSPGAYEVTLNIKPRYVEDNTTGYDELIASLQTEIPNDYNFGMSTTKGLYVPHDMAFPYKYVMSPEILGTEDAKKIKDALPEDAVDLDAQPKSMKINVGAVIWATGWTPYDATKIDTLGFGQYDNIITNMMMERYASTNGPTQGKIVRPSDRKEPESIAFVQCAGSRDENYLPYCSYICCMASLKQATYIREQYPDAKIYIFYIDLRTPGQRYEKFYKQVKEDENIFFIKGKVAEVSEDPATQNITVVAENAVTGQKIHQSVELVVLATGMQPTAKDNPLPANLKTDENGFIVNDLDKGGMFAAGCANKPLDVVSSNQNATGMALRAIQTLVNR